MGVIISVLENIFLLPFYILAGLRIKLITLYAEQKKKKDRFIEQSFGLCGRRRGWDVSREQHRNMYII